jgi:hypothetical protein
MNKHNLLKVAEATRDLVAEATSHEELEALADLALGAKKVLDLSGLQLDIGQDLLEFAQLKRDGEKEQAGRFRGIVADDLSKLEDA